MRKKISGALVLSVGIAMWAGAAQPPQSQSGSPPASTAQQSEAKSQAEPMKGGTPVLEQRRPRYRLAPSDVLDLQFPFSPELNQTVTIQPDGFITLVDIGDFYAQGKTTPELAKDLESAYGKILNDPVITVDLKDFQKPYFVVGGQVGHPGKYDLRADTTVVEAIEIAGGFTPDSKHSQVLLFRGVSANQVEVKKLNVKKMLKSADLSEDIYLHPGDMLYVPKNAISKIRQYLPTQSLSMYFSPATW